MKSEASLDAKIVHTKAILSMLLPRYQNPAVMCSFGKDSIVLLHILRDLGHETFAVIFHRDPWFPRKYAFADQVIRDWNLRVFDYPPLGMTMWEANDTIVVTSHYQIGTSRAGRAVLMALPMDILPPAEGKPLLCGLKDVLQRPTGGLSYPWDLALVAHKSSDQDKLTGPIPLKCDVKQNGGEGPDFGFPLREWTDDDVWEYTDRFGVPVHQERYERTLEGWHERVDKTENPDYWHGCIACCDRRQGATVRCPRLNGLEVTNISDRVLYQPVTADYCGEKEFVS